MATRRWVRYTPSPGRPIDLTGGSPFGSRHREVLGSGDPSDAPRGWKGKGMERLKSVGRLGAQPIGMDIDRGAIKAVQISTGAGSYILRHVGYHRLPPGTIVEGRSEEHTSELQSRQYLVCRLLLEKKKIRVRSWSLPVVCTSVPPL